MGNMINKYRVHEVAKDFGLPTKDIVEILTKYATAPKNHMQVLEDSELSIIFDYLTQKNPVSGIEVIFADAYQEPQVETPKEATPAQQKSADHQTAPAAGNKGGQPAAKAPAQQPQQPGQAAKSAAPAAPVVQKSRVPEKKVVDTRKATNVNLEKYDERLEDIADSSTRGGRNMQQQQGKEKFRNAGNKKKQQQMTFSNKRKQEEQEKMRRLQLEIAKKTPLKVLIPDEISVGELASRMKKAATEVVKCLMKNGVMASVSQIIDFDTASFVAEELGCKVEKEVVVTIEE